MLALSAGLSACNSSTGGSSTSAGSSATATDSGSEDTTAAAGDVDQGIPADWVEVESLMDKYPGPQVTLEDWLADHKDLKAKENYRIAVIMYSLQNEFPVLMSEAIKKRAEQVGVTVDIFDAEMDTSIELEKAENIIADQYDAVALNCVDSDGSATVAQKCKEAGIPIICFNVLLNDVTNIDGFATSDHIQSGEINAQYIIEEVLGGEGNIVIPEGPLAQGPTLDRSQGIYNIVRQYPDVKVLAHDTANWSRSEALSLMENWINAFPDEIDAVIGENDEMALGCLQAVKTEGGDKTVYAGGIDCIPDALVALENDEMQCTVLQDAIAQAVVGFDLCTLILNGDIEPGIENAAYWIPYELVTKDQTDEYRMRTDLSVLD
jgi:ABC-type sugar transport system substrate-binding protein